MNMLPVCVVYTQDPGLTRRISGHLHGMAVVKPIAQPGPLATVLEQFGQVILLADLRGPDIVSLLPDIIRNRPSCLIVALGVPHSDPVRSVEDLPVFAIESLEIDHRRLQSLLQRGEAHLRLLQENRALKQAATRKIETVAPAPLLHEGASMPLHLFARAFRNFENVETMLDNIVEGVANCAKVSRVGIFALDRNAKTYRLRAGIRCMEDAHHLSVPADAPLVGWMELHAHLISRATLAHITDPTTLLLLEQSLDALGAEVIIPLHGRRHINGWLFLGHQVTGIPFSPTHLEELTLLAEHVSLSLENALLYEESALQRNLSETVIESMTVGIVAVDANSVICSFNRQAADLFGVEPAQILNRPATALDSRAANLLTSRIHNERLREPARWIDPITKKPLSVMTRQLLIEGRCAGAVAIVSDMTREDQLRERQNQVERAAFWVELASAMSHAVRNPLVAISTFAQLLPEKYGDAEFREQFSALVGREIGRLNDMIDQLTTFASPGELMFKRYDIAVLLEEAVVLAGRRTGLDAKLIEISAEPGLPEVLGDKRSLVDGLAHLIGNALEAVRKTIYPSIHVTAGSMSSPDGEYLVVNVQDNGGGIPDKIKANVFSPFCTEKVCGIGLGLPIMRRTVEDHGGEMSIETSAKGTNVTVLLPVASVGSTRPQEKAVSPS